MMESQVQVTPVPVFEYKLITLYRHAENEDKQDELSRVDERELNKLGADGWGVLSVVLDGTTLLLARQVAVRLIPVEEPKILGAQPILTLKHPPSPGNGR